MCVCVRARVTPMFHDHLLPFIGETGLPTSPADGTGRQSKRPGVHPHQRSQLLTYIGHLTLPVL